jgi:2-haloacid dehalogenase
MPAPTPALQALLFDIFGTIFSWKESITNALKRTLSPHLPPNTPPPSYYSLALEWRASYLEFTRSFDPSVSSWTSIDAFHLDSLQQILSTHGLWHRLSSRELQDLTLAWHRLSPWPDSRRGVAQLGERYVTTTLSNGNRALLDHLQRHGGVVFQQTFSAEDFGAYKPHLKVYLGAAHRLGLEPGECAMVAAHLGDLEAAKALGLRCVYVEREGEGSWEREAVDRARREGWVDVWIALEKGRSRGLQSVAEELERKRL